MKELGAKKARILNYSNSFETSGDYSAVVGYGSVGIKC
jgi:AmmeMemoRadiSam system protein B